MVPSRCWRRRMPPRGIQCVRYLLSICSSQGGRSPPAGHSPPPPWAREAKTRLPRRLGSTPVWVSSSLTFAQLCLTFAMASFISTSGSLKNIGARPRFIHVQKSAGKLTSLWFLKPMRSCSNGLSADDAHKAFSSRFVCTACSMAWSCRVRSCHWHTMMKDTRISRAAGKCMQDCIWLRSSWTPHRMLDTLALTWFLCLSRMASRQPRQVSAAFELIIVSRWSDMYAGVCTYVKMNSSKFTQESGVLPIFCMRFLTTTASHGTLHAVNISGMSLVFTIPPSW
mmetsp:Transcript_17896/g.47257  ORF Transcript_17896/g.47257 Transcript_17896/m.47257 type:complete len:282 (+) Transcript_17896:727-1572(+)